MRSGLKEPKQTENNLDEIKGMIFRRLIIAYAILGFVAYVPSMILAITSKIWPIAIIDTAGYSIILLLTFNNNFGVQIKVITTLFISLAIGVVVLFYAGPFGAGYLWIFTVPVIAAVLLEFWFSIAAVVINIGILIIFGALQYYGILEWNKLFSYNVTSWTVLSVNFILLNIGTTLPLALFIGKLENSLMAGKEIANKLTRERIELIKAKSEAETANRLKSEFLAQMSHEVRSPINTILNFVSLIKEDIPGPINAEMQYSFSAIDNSSKRLIRTIDMILNMSQVQAGHIECNYQVLDMEKDVLQAIIIDYSSVAAAKKIKLSFSNDSGNSKVIADLYSVNQICINLIDNAIKYTREGEIKVRIYQETSGEVCVDVSDTGIGISEEYMGKLFTPFSQEEQGYTRKYDGNGLGLALVKKYCELNNAQIDVKSKKGVGSVLSVKFSAFNTGLAII